MQLPESEEDHEHIPDIARGGKRRPGRASALNRRLPDGGFLRIHLDSYFAVLGPGYHLLELAQKIEADPEKPQAAGALFSK